MYISNLLKKFGFTDIKPAKTPMSPYMMITADPNGTDVNATMYGGMIGSLPYLTASCPDVMFATTFSARYQANPN